MNYRFVFNQLAILLAVLGIVLLVLVVGFFVLARFRGAGIDADARISLIATGGGGMLIGFFAWFYTRSKDQQIGRRDALLLVAVSWLAGAAFAALPYLIWAHTADSVSPGHPFRNFVDCYFEAMSGLTTTGATVLGAAPDDIESLPRSLLLWRAFTQWLGGLGIVVLFVAVLPGLGVGGKRLFRIEAPGPSHEGITPHIRETARVLWYIYLTLTVIQIGALMVAGMNLFNATCHAFTTLATAGFSTKNASVGAYSGLAIPIIFIIFMVLGGTNFNLLFAVFRGRWRAVLKDTELRVYLILLTAGCAIIALSLIASPSDIESTVPGETVASTAGTSIREAVFTGVSIQTTSGFATSDSNQWPFIAKAVLILFMFVGGCAGSTGGGIKVVRVWVALKIMFAEIERIFRPNVVRPLRLAGGAIDPELKLATVSYVLGIVLIFAVGAVGVMLLEQGYGSGEVPVTFQTAATSSLATLSTIGPGFGAVGAIENYGWMSSPTKVLLSMLMVIGRLEVFAILVLFSPRFWRGD